MRLLIVVAFACVYSATAKPFWSFIHFKIPDVTACHGIVCPKDTVTCIKNATSTNDDKQIRTEVICKDLNDHVLLNDVKLTPNPDGTYTTSFSYRKYISHVHNTELKTDKPKEEFFDEIETLN